MECEERSSVTYKIKESELREILIKHFSHIDLTNCHMNIHSFRHSMFSDDTDYDVVSLTTNELIKNEVIDSE